MALLETFLKPFQIAVKQAVETFINLETADDEYTLATSDGSLVSYVRVDGSRQIIGDQEYEHIIKAATLKIGSRFDRQGHGLQIYFVRDPGRIEDKLGQLIQPSRTTATSIGLEIEDLFQERIRHLTKFLSYEECYFVLWTRPSVLTKAESDRITKGKSSGKGKDWVNAPDAQNPFAGLDALRNRHKSLVVSVTGGLEEIGIRGELMKSHDALRAVRNNLYPLKANDRWNPCLPGDPIPPRAPKSVTDMSDILWPPLREQLAVGDSRVVDDKVVQIGDLLWAGADIVLAPMDPSPFPQLLNRLFESKVPYRMSFMIEGGGAQAMAFQTFMATIFGVTNAANRQIKYALEGLEAMSRKEPVVKLRVSFATWAPRGQRKLLDERLSVLVQAVESWGYCQVSEVSGDPLDCVMSSAMGIHCAGTAPAAVAPMYDVMKLLPWQRPSSPFDDGAIMLRTPDGKVWPYQTGTSLTTTWFDLIFAQPGGGKSVLMNTLNLGTILSPGLSRLPYVAVIDIGPSSAGLISLIKDALPPSRAHEANTFRLQMSQDYAINPFDTQLGCRKPLADERSYLTQLMTLLCTPPGNDKPYDGIQQLSGFVIDEMFRWRDDNQANAEPRPYLPRIDAQVDDVIRKHNIHLPTDPYWWDVVDKMYDLDMPEIANLAQRHAVPILSDAITASRRPQIRTLMEQTTVGSGTENVINAFERMITSGIKEYPILASVTKFEITDARVCSLDLMDVSPQGDETADRQTAIMYMLGRHALVRAWWMGPESLTQIPEKYRPYHEMRLQELSETPKRLCYDEFHRTSSSAAVRGQIIRDVREGRKRSVQIVLASQLLDDFDDDMVDLATGVWVLGTAVSEKAVDNVRDRFGLSDSARHVIRHNLTGPRSSGGPCLLILGTKDGRYEQHLISTLGPVELWSFSTSTEDVSLRSRLYNQLGAQRARRILSIYFPGGSARTEVKRRVIAIAESGEGDTKDAAVGAVIDTMVDELVAASIKLDEPGN
jgi:intracellular multiplication protein IcmB